MGITKVGRHEAKVLLCMTLVYLAGVTGMNVKKVTVAVPLDLFEAAEQRWKADNSNRSKLYADAVTLYLEGACNTEYEEGITQLRGHLERVTQERDRATEQAAQKAASHNTAVSGLQHELELAKKDTKNLSEQVVELKGQLQDLKDDKQNLRKQLELVTLRLPAPKEGFWSRVFGRRKKDKEQEAAT